MQHICGFGSRGGNCQRAMESLRTKHRSNFQGREGGNMGFLLEGGQ